jgi:hypothetical protein
MKHHVNFAVAIVRDSGQADRAIVGLPEVFTISSSNGDAGDGQISLPIVGHLDRLILTGRFLRLRAKRQAVNRQAHLRIRGAGPGV